MPTRKAHEKNRHGCQPCKARRVKCNLRLPVCSNCERRSEACVRDQLQPLARSPASVSPPTTTSRSTSLPLLELELMHHFSTVVCKTLSEETKVQDLWQQDVPKDALQHTHLMHAILALSALHLQSSSHDPQRTAKYRESANQHFDLALSQLQLLVVEIDEPNCGSVLAAATLLGFFRSASMSFEENNSDILDEMWHNHQLLRGVHTIIKHAATYFSEMKLSIMFKPKPWNHVLVPDGFRQGMDILRTNISTFGGGDESRTEIYLRAVQGLQENVKAEIANPQHITISYMFLPAADRRYMELVGARDPLALVILEHYAVILHRQRHQWWMGDNGVKLFGGLKELLETDFKPLVEWPEQFLSACAGTQPMDAALYYS